MLRLTCRFKSGLILPLAVFLALFLEGQAAWAQTLTENNRLTFGRIVMRDNNAPRDVALTPTGSYVADPAYVFYAETPQLGSYTINGQTPNAVMDIMLDVAATAITPNGGGGGAAQFTLVDPFTVPAVVVTNGGGSATFEIGATLRSDGSGQTFLDANYIGNYTIIVTPQ